MSSDPFDIAPRGFLAQFESTCWECGGDILEGDPIKRDKFGDWVHAEHRDVIETVCPKCFLTSCDCDKP
jgi:hypothetical protein